MTIRETISEGREENMLSLDTKKKAIALIALMMVSALAGCLGNDDDDTDDSSDSNNNNDNTNNTTTVDDNTGIDVGTVTCGPDGSIKIAGSSTVLPLAEIWAEYYQENCEGVTITVESGGSGGGAGRVCANSAKGTPVDIGDMSRDWKDTEATRGDDGYTMDCLAGDTSRSARQIQVAIDGLSVVMKKGGAADTCVNTHLGGLTVDQLRWMFSAEADTGYTPANDDGDAVKEWSDLDADCGAAEIVLAYPDADSGTYEYFYETVLDEAEEGFRSGTQSADDNVLVNTLTGDETSIGYFGYAYYQENMATLAAAAIENSAGNMVAPTSTSVGDGTYNPLSRPLFMNLLVDADSLANTVPFLKFGLGNGGDKLVAAVGYVALPSSLDSEMIDRLDAEIGGHSDGIDVGTVTCGPDGSIKIAGSSTVLPLAEIWAEYYQDNCEGVTITVESGGSGGGAGRVCANSAKGTPVDIGDMSRDWKDTEATRGDDGYTMDCLAGDTSRSARQIQVAIDGLSVVMKKGGAADVCVNTHLGGLTVNQLHWMFTAETDLAYNPSNDDGDAVKEWSDLSADCGNAEIVLAYPDADSGTYEYFYETVLDEAEEGFRSGTQSADDNVLVNALTGDETAIGYFGYAYYQENMATLAAAAIENSAGNMVAPTSTSVGDGTYNPLSRPLFMNLLVDADSLANTVPFLKFGLGDGGDKLVAAVGYVALPSSLDSEMIDRLDAEIGGHSDGIDVGTVTCGPDGSIKIAGSSTVLPLAEIWAEYYQDNCEGVTITVESGGSGGGAGRVCANSAKGTPVDIGDMSRDWKDTEADRRDDGYTMDCLAGDTSRSARQIQVAIDGLSVVMKKGGAADVCVNTHLGGLTVDQLRWIFTAETDFAYNPSNDDGDTTREWSDLSADCGNAEIVLAYPDADSGTYEYFYETVLDEAEEGFRSGTQSADDNVLVNTLIGDETSIGYFGYAYYQENMATLAAAAVENSAGNMVAPTSTSVGDGTYNPLSRPLFMNLLNDEDSLENTVPFLEFGLGDGGDLLVAEVGYVALPDSLDTVMASRLAGGVGASFCGPDGSISIAGSSTVLPLAEAWAEDYQNACDGVTITVESGGSGGGAGRVCANSAKGTPVDIGDMSRDWKSTEADRQANGFILDCLAGDTSRDAAQIQVAIDGLSVVMKKGGAADTCVNTHLGGLTVHQLRWIFSAETDAELVGAGLDLGTEIGNDDGDTTREWSDLNANCGDAEIVLAYPDADSGTYEYFYETALDEASAGFRAGTQSADDNVLVNALTGDETAIGYFGYAYYQENMATLAAAAIENSDGNMITPNANSVRDGSYNPLSRPLFMNLLVDGATLENTIPFMLYGLDTEAGSQAVAEVGYVSLNDYQKHQMVFGRLAHLQGFTTEGNDHIFEDMCAAAGSISIAGSSTVLPLAEAWAEDYQEICGDTSITVESGGSGAGAGRVCANSAKGTPVDIGDMSRDWKSTEGSVDANGQLNCLVGDTSITVTQLVVAVDGLSVVSKKGGAADVCMQNMGGMTAAQLRWVFSAETDTELTAAGLVLSSVVPNDDGDGVKEWSDLSANCGSNAIVLAYPDADSGTYEYFYEEILHEAAAGFGTGTQSSDDNVLVNAILGDEHAIGYFGYAYYQENMATLGAVAVSNNHTHGVADAPEDAVAPTPQTVRDGSYAPLSRPLFMNVNNDAWDKVSPFLQWAFSGDGSAVISEVGYVPLDDATYQEMIRRILAEGVYAA